MKSVTSGGISGVNTGRRNLSKRQAQIAERRAQSAENIRERKFFSLCSMRLAPCDTEVENGRQKEN